MKKLKSTLALLLAMLMLLSCCACGAKNVPDSASASTGEQPAEITTPKAQATVPPTDEGPVYGGILNMTREGTMGENDLFPHMKANGMINVTMSPAVEKLFYLDGNANMVPQLAESWDVSDDSLVWTFHLVKGVKFHDGSDFNAEVAMWNLQLAKDVSAEATTTNGMIESMKVIDDNTLEVKFSTMNATLMLMLDVWMVSQKAYEENGLEWCTKNPVGTGPFKFDHWTLDSELVYTKNENYWGNDADGNQLPYLDGVTFKVIKDPTVLAASAQNREVDIMTNIASSDLANTLMAQGDVTKLTAANPASIVVLLPAGTETSPLNNANVRKALAYAIDFDEIVESLFDPTMNMSLNQTAIPGSIFYNDDIVSYSYDKEKAIELLKQEGFDENNRLSVVFVSENIPAYVDQGEAIQAYLADVNVDCELLILEAAAFLEKVILNPWEDNWIVNQAIAYTAGVPLTGTNRLMGANHAKYFPCAFFPDEWVENVVKSGNQPSLEAAAPDYKLASESLLNDYCCFLGIRAGFDAAYVKDGIQGYDYTNLTPQYSLVWKQTQ